MRTGEWFLTSAERGNPATLLDARRGDGLAWSSGNQVTALIHGATYFGELAARIDALEAGDLLLFTDWRGDPDQRLRAGGPAVAEALCSAAGRGVLVRGLIWRSHLDKLAFSAEENRHLDEDIDGVGGQCLLDMRVRAGGSHHMKLAVLRHRRRPELDVAFVGGIDLCHSRRDDESHEGDPQKQPMAAVYGSRPPWHDLQAMIQGPAVGDVEAVFRERWDDPAPLSRNPVHWLRDRLSGNDTQAGPLPPQGPDPLPCGPMSVQLLRTYPSRRPGYRFAPDGERSVARGYLKALARARSLIYLEDQYLWSKPVAAVLAAALRDNPGLRLIAVLPRFPDQDGKLSEPPNLIGRVQALKLLRAAGGDRVGVYSLENSHGTPIYVHAKVCIVDDAWATVGSDNFNRRSWTHDSELTCAVLGFGAGQGACAGLGTGFGAALRQALGREHLGCGPSDLALASGAGMFEAFRRAAALLDEWHDGGRAGPRPPGQLRAYPDPELGTWTRAWACVPYHLIYDPDGRPLPMRLAGSF
ncbi:MAG TPA: phospholipase D family protein [Streptosporangiaceae bacterium]|nr:phospholipase D family protein [Streptosporangiaceae bacterium]